MPNAGTITSDIRIDTKTLQQDLLRVEAALKSGSGNLSKYLKSATTAIQTYEKKNAKTLANNVALLKELRTAYIKMASKSEDKTQYEKAIESLNKAIVKAINYEKVHSENVKKKVAEQKKATKESKDATKATEKQKESQQRLSKAVFLGNVQYRIFAKAIQLVKQGLREGLKVSIEYEQALANAQSVAQATSQELRDLDTAARRAGETTRYTATEAAKALYFMASAGYSASESVQALDGVLAMAQATWSELDHTAEIVAITLAQFNLQASEALRVANAMTAGITSSQATMDKYRVSLYQVGPVAAGVGRSMEETLGVLNAMYDAGMQASRAGRAMRNALAELSNENSITVRKLKSLGIAFEDVDVSERSLVDVFGTLNEAGLDAGQVMEVFGKVIGPQMQILIRATREELQGYVKDVTDTNKAQTAAHIQNDTIQGDWFRLKSSAEAYAITLTKLLTPVIRGFLQIVFKTIRGLNTFTKTLFGTETSADKLYNTMRKVTDLTDEYSRLTSILEDDTNRLTESETRLYEIRRRQIALDISEKLGEISGSYSSVVSEVEAMNKALQFNERVIEHNQMVSDFYFRTLALNAKDRSSVYAMSANGVINETEALAEMYNKIRLSYRGLQIVSNRFHQDVSEFPDAVGGIEQSISNAFIVPVIEAIDNFGNLKTSVNAGVNAMVSAVEGIKTRDWDDIIALDPNSIKGVIDDLANLSFKLESKAISMESNVQEVVTTAARLLNMQAITETELLGLNPELVAAITLRAKEYSNLSKDIDGNTESTYDNMSAIQDQIIASGKASKALDQYISNQKESSAQTLASSDNIDDVNRGYKLLESNIKDTTKSLSDEAEAQYQENLELIMAAEGLSKVSKETLEALAASVLKSEQDRISQVETLQLIQLERNRLQAIGETTSAELVALEQRRESYEKTASSFQEYSDRLSELQRQRIDESIKEAFATAKNTEDIEKALEDRKKLNESDKDAELQILEDKIIERKALIDKAMLDEQLSRESAEAVSIKALDEAETAKLAELEQQLTNRAITEEEYNQQVSDTEASFEAERVARRAQTEQEILNISEAGKAVKVGITEDGEKAEYAVIAYYNDKVTDLEDEAVKAEEERQEKIRKDWEDTLSAISSVISDIDALVSASYDKQIAQVERALEAKLTALDAEEQAELESKGLLEETERERLEREIQEARQAGNAQAIIEAQEALARYDIQKKYDDKQAELEKEATNRKLKLEYNAAMAAWAIEAAQIASSAALAIVKAWNSPLPWVQVPLTVVGTGLQLAAHSQAKPVEPTYLENGGIIRGSASGTPIIAGEKNKTEVMLNQDHMANLLMAIGKGQSVDNKGMQVTFVMQDTNNKEQARYTVDLINKGQYLIDPKRGIQKVR